MHTYIYTHRCMHTRIYAYNIHTYTCIHKHTYVCTSVCLCMRVCMCMYAHMYMYVCIIYRENCPGGKCPTQNGRVNYVGGGESVIYPHLLNHKSPKQFLLQFSI